MIENRNVNIITDADGKKLVLINDIRFKGKWQEISVRHSGNKKRNEQAVTRCTVKTHFLLSIISLFSVLSSPDFFFFAAYFLNI